MSMKAVIIAAGKGQRLRKWDWDQPKPLYKVVGLSLIERAILSAKKAGITEFVIVTGYKGDQIRKKLSKRQKRLGVSIEFVDNPEWEKSNGFSVLKAKPCLQDNFVLMMSDHIFDWKILSELTKQDPRDGEVLLAVDRRLNEIFDMDDATKVRTSNGSIVEIGKEIAGFDAVDTGLFFCSSGSGGLFNALERACTEGKGSLSEAIRFLAASGKARTFTIPDHYWQDVDTPESLRHAQKILFQSVKKPTDGIISRNFNRKISVFISRFLVKTPLTPNQITWSALVIGLMSGFFVARGTYWHVALGGILFQFASIYDGCDGEVAKLKLASSKLGEWLDTVCDNITYVVFFAGAMVGLSRQGYPSVMSLGIFSGFGVLMTLGSMYLYLIRNTDSGSLVTVERDAMRDMEAVEQNGFIRALGKLKFLAKRDFFALFFMALCLVDRLEWILILTAIGSNLMWIMVLTMKRDYIQAKAQLSRN